MFRTAIAATAATLTLSAAPVAAATVADVYSSFWVFGDSLSDSGNISAIFEGLDPPIDFPPEPYFEGRFSNGPVWHEEFTLGFAPGASGSLAVGGARAVSTADPLGLQDLPEQVALFTAGVDANLLTLGDTPLAAIFSGANDILGAAAAAALGFVPEPAQDLFFATTAKTVVASIGAAVDTLAGSGIGDFALFTLPDLGATPRIAALGGAEVGRKATIAFNTAFDTLVQDLRDDGLSIYTVDIFALFDDAVANPGKYGLTNVADACLPVDPFDILTGTPVPQACGNPEAFLFWDALHPSSTGHAAIAAAFDAAVPAVPVPASAVLLLAGLGGLAALRRRRAA